MVRGDPLKAHIVSTDSFPVYMEAHQQLGESVETDSCGSLRLTVVNADAMPGLITVEVLLRNTKEKTNSLSLGVKVLVSSTVAPMPLRRSPVQEVLTFPILSSASRGSVDEIVVRIRPESMQSLAGPHVSIRSFTLEPAY